MKKHFMATKFRATKNTKASVDVRETNYTSADAFSELVVDTFVVGVVVKFASGATVVMETFAVATASGVAVVADTFAVATASGVAVVAFEDMFIRAGAALVKVASGATVVMETFAVATASGVAVVAFESMFGANVAKDPLIFAVVFVPTASSMVTFVTLLAFDDAKKLCGASSEDPLLQPDFVQNLMSRE